MTTKNMLGGALINYGDTLPPVGGAPDGALFLKTGGGAEGLYIYRLIGDTNPGIIGSQTAAGWQTVVSSGSGVNADTLDGFDSTYFQPADSDLTALAALGTTGFVVRTGAGTFASRTLVAGTAISLSSPSDGTAGNVTIGVNEGSLNLNSIGGTLSLGKGGTNSTSTPPAGSVISSNGSSYSATSVGSSGQLLQSAGAGTPAWVSPSALTVGSATNASFANQATSATQLGGLLGDFDATPNTIAARDSGANISVQLVRSIFPNQSYVAGGLVFRVNNTDDNFLRVCSDTGAIRTFLDAPSRAGAGASGTWDISISGSASSANSAGNANSLTTPRNFNITGPAAAASQLTTEGSVTFNGGADVTLRISTVGASLLTGTVANERISGSYTNFESITASQTVAANSLVLSAPAALIRKNDTAGTVELTGGNAADAGANIKMYGPTAAGTPDIGRLRVGSTSVAAWNTAGININGAVQATSANFTGAQVTLGSNAASVVSVSNNRVRDVADATVTTDAVNLGLLQSALAGTSSSLFESGVWTPTLRFGTTVYSGTYSQRDGLWYRIGELVYVMAYIRVGTFVGAPGNVNITGFPFLSAGVHPGHVSFNSTFPGLAGNLQALSNGNLIEIRVWTPNGESQFLTEQAFRDGTILQTTCFFPRGNLSAATANFTASPTSGNDPLTVAFTDMSSGSIVSRLWDFGDGTTSTAVNPIHTYAAGTYTVSLVVTSLSGATVTETKTNYITVTIPSGGTIPNGGGGGGGGSVAVNAFLPSGMLAGAAISGDSLVLLGDDRESFIDGEVISNRVSTQNLVTLVSESGIRLTMSDNTPLTLRDGSASMSVDALGVELPVMDQDGFRWETITEVIPAGQGQVATIFCDHQCYAAGDERGRYIFTHNEELVKN